MPARPWIVALACLGLGCAEFFRPQGPLPYRTPYTMPAPTVALRRRPPVPEPVAEAKSAVTVGDTTTMFGKPLLTKLDEDGEPFTITTYRPNYFIDEEEYDPYVSCDVYVVEAEKLARAVDHPKPGTTICIGDGEYTDLDIKLVGAGTDANPIVLSPRHPGRVVLRGKTHISMAGVWLTVRGLRIEGARSAEPRLVEFRAKVGNRHMACHNCRVSELVVSDVDRGRSDNTAWVAMFGQENRVDHSVFLGKDNPGPMLETWRPGDDPDNHLIDHNLFARRRPVASDGEALRIGTAAEQRSDSFTIVQDNLFEDLRGGDEYVSSRSSAVAFLANTFRRCSGMLALRHGDGDVVDGNLFLTERIPDGGGIRVIDGHHRIVNNYVEGVRTRRDDSGGVVLMSYDRGYTENGFQSVVHVLVAHNTIIDSEQSLVIGGGKNRMSPRHVTLGNNLLAYPMGPVTRTGVGMREWYIAGNVVHGGHLDFADKSGFWFWDPKLYRDYDGLARPSDDSPLIGAVEEDMDADFDVDGQARSLRPDIGADETINASGPAREPLTRNHVGPKTYTP